MSDDIKRVYTGSRAEGLWIQEVLKESGIGSILKDTLSSSVQAGWADGAPEDALRIFVDAHKEMEAKQVIEDYFANRKPLDEDNQD